MRTIIRELVEVLYKGQKADRLLASYKEKEQDYTAEELSVMFQEETIYYRVKDIEKIAKAFCLFIRKPGFVKLSKAILMSDCIYNAIAAVEKEVEEEELMIEKAKEEVSLLFNDAKKQLEEKIEEINDFLENKVFYLGRQEALQSVLLNMNWYEILKFTKLTSDLYKKNPKKFEPLYTEIRKSDIVFQILVDTISI